MKKEFSLKENESQGVFLNETLQFSENALIDLLKDKSLVGKPLLCIEEVVTNIVNHSPKAHHGRVIIEIKLLPVHTLVIEIKDQGEPFDISKFFKRKKEGEIGGVGILLIRSIMDIEYQYVDGWNCVLLKKQY
jgi:anti-sigma regulatory factor (Ser/Thr protein kinase)